MNNAQIDLEYGIIGDFFTSDVNALKTLIERNGLKSSYFTDNTTRRAYEKILELNSDDNQLLALEVTTLLGIEAYEKAVECSRAGYDGYQVAAHARRIEKLVKDGRMRELQSTLSEANKLAADPKISAEYFAASVISAMKPFTQTANGSAVMKPMKLSDLGPRIPESENPKVLIEGEWMCKGHAVSLVSVSGAGKSIITMQFCYAWALGREMFGIKPLRPLKIAVFQTEDDDNDLRLFRDAMSYGYIHNHGWTDADIEKAVENIDFFPILGIMGDEFVEYFRKVQSTYNYDLIIINPLQGVADFDISDNTLMKNWATKKIDPIIKDPEKGCALFIIHHTNKMSGDLNHRPSGGKDPFAQYTGSGAGVFYNWCRAHLLILPYNSSKFSGYQLVAAKRGGRLKRWEKRPGYALPTKFICHSADEANYPFWSEMSAPESAQTDVEKAEIAEKAKADALENDVKLLIAKITEPMTASLVREKARLLFNKSRGDSVYKHFTEHLADYDFVQRKGINNNSKVLGTLAMFQAEQTS